MSDSASQAFGGPVRRDGVDWPRLLMSDYAKLEGRVRENRRFLARQLLEECGVTSPGDKFVGMRDAATSEVSALDVNAYLGTSAGAKAALELSLAKTEHPDKAKLIESMPIMDAAELARELVGFLDPEKKAGKKEKKEGDANPPNPAG
jgi:hypothetical protein